WRLNGKGYFAGMISGITAALLFPIIFPMLSPLNAFPFILVISLGFSIVASLMTRPESDKTLKAFYKQVRPWGLWRPVLEKVLAEDPGFVKNNDMVKNIINVIVALTWQSSLVVIPIYLVIKHYRGLGISLAVMAATSIWLKFYWYDKLPKDE
ncbi:MAG: sodium:solute symporter, partial [Planctomycetes bacterium]|nr:sodium:solute symporter [Planctomycetota bacterium]